MQARPTPIQRDDPRLVAFTLSPAATSDTLAQIDAARKAYAAKRAARTTFTVLAEDGTPIILPFDRRRSVTSDASTVNLLARQYARRKTDRFVAEPAAPSAFGALA